MYQQVIGSLGESSLQEDLRCFLMKEKVMVGEGGGVKRGLNLILETRKNIYWRLELVQILMRRPE